MTASEPPPTTANAPASTGAWRQTFAALDTPAFSLYFLGYTLYFLGVQMMWTLRGWLAYDLTHKPSALGLVTFSFAVPVILLTPIAGVMTDRLDKRNIILWTHCVSVVLNGLTMILILTGVIQFWQLFGLALLTGFIMPFSVPARMAIIAEFVPKARLMNAIALVSGAASVAQIAGPALAGALVAPIGIRGGYAVLTIFQAISVWTMLKVPKMGIRDLSANADVGRQFMKAIHYIRRDDLLTGLLVLSLVPAIFILPYTVMLPAFAEKVWRVGATEYSFLISISAVGAFTGSVLAAHLGGSQRKGLLMAAAVVLSGVFLFLFALSPSYYLALAFIAGIGFGSMVFGALNGAAIQTIVSDEMRGRVSSVMNWSWSLSLLATLPIGFFADDFGLPTTIATCAALSTIISLALFLSTPSFRRMDATMRHALDGHHEPIVPAAIASQTQIDP